jgi:hypothetical protein
MLISSLSTNGSALPATRASRKSADPPIASLLTGKYSGNLSFPLLDWSGFRAFLVIDPQNDLTLNVGGIDGTGRIVVKSATRKVIQADIHLSLNGFGLIVIPVTIKIIQTGKQIRVTNEHDDFTFFSIPKIPDKRVVRFRPTPRRHR